MWNFFHFTHMCLLLIRLHNQQEYLFLASINGQETNNVNTVVMFIKRLHVHIMGNQCSLNG